VIPFPLLIVVLGLSALSNPVELVGMAVGLSAGALLGVVGLRKTVYERIGGAFFYTPNPHKGILVLMLFVGRLHNRRYEYYMFGAAHPSDFATSPLTLMVFGVLAGYYTTYAAGILRWRKTAPTEN
jgi:hypothetical protein